MGTAVGLIFGHRVVHLIERPLTKALGSYYSNDAKTKYGRWADDRIAKKRPVPYSEKQIASLVDDHGLLFDIRYVDPLEASRELQRQGPDSLGGVMLPSATTARDSPSTNELTETAGEEEADADAVATAKTIQARLIPVFLFHHINDDPRIRPSTLSAIEAFSIWFKASLVLGAVISSPWVFWQIWSFVAAGLYPHEKGYVYKFMPFSLGLFLLGAATAYLFVFEPVLNFLFNYNAWLEIDPEPRISEWLGFVLLLPIGFGISFQLPLVMLFLERIGVFNVSAYLQKWRISVMVIFVLSAVLTPADPYSIFFMAGPLMVLYFVGILLCKWRPRNRNLWDESREEKKAKE